MDVIYRKVKCQTSSSIGHNQIWAYNYGVHKMDVIYRKVKCQTFVHDYRGMVSKNMIVWRGPLYEMGGS